MSLSQSVLARSVICVVTFSKVSVSHERKWSSISRPELDGLTCHFAPGKSLRTHGSQMEDKAFMKLQLDASASQCLVGHVGDEYSFAEYRWHRHPLTLLLSFFLSGVELTFGILLI